MRCSICTDLQATTTANIQNEGKNRRGKMEGQQKITKQLEIHTDKANAASCGEQLRKQIC